MITEPASAIKQEVLQLIDLQIETLRQDSPLDSTQLQDYQVRSKRIRQLYAELDQDRWSKNNAYPIPSRDSEQER